MVDDMGAWKLEYVKLIVVDTTLLVATGYLCSEGEGERLPTYPLSLGVIVNHCFEMHDLVVWTCDGLL